MWRRTEAPDKKRKIVRKYFLLNDSWKDPRCTRPPGWIFLLLNFTRIRPLNNTSHSRFPKFVVGPANTCARTHTHTHTHVSPIVKFLAKWKCKLRLHYLQIDNCEISSLEFTIQSDSIRKWDHVNNILRIEYKSLRYIMMN